MYNRNHTKMTHTLRLKKECPNDQLIKTRPYLFSSEHQPQYGSLACRQLLQVPYAAHLSTLYFETWGEQRGDGVRGWRQL